MAKLVLCIVMFAAVVVAHRRHPKFPKSEEYSIPLSGIKGEYRKVACGGDNARERDKIIEQSKCGEPKPVFVHLDPKVGHEQVSPGAVWVKRCVGICEYDNAGSCVATESVIRHIPIRVYNAKTNKESCAMYPVEEHVSCGCCALEPDKCAPPKVFNRRKCTCQCPNLEERRDCLKQRNLNMKWNRSKCACEQRRKVQT
ncbi:PDGF/VEGF-related factor 1 [Operophtera brumata]|uniref:PDGF/VEGF-related factor 1 n=1 Tax=Operophtera brumata TaxID=104452 RepID=A0A0L7KWS4_OPEBR|nr:PDGF/VEGF-related factor 1 [Operophtera brumata]